MLPVLPDLNDWFDTLGEGTCEFAFVDNCYTLNKCQIWANLHYNPPPFIFARFDWLIYVMWRKITGQLSRNNHRLGQHLSAGCFPCFRPKEAKPAEEIQPETSFFFFINKLTYQPPERVYSVNSTNNTQAVTKGVFTLFQWFARFNTIFLLPTWHLTLNSIAKFALCNNG